MKVYDLRREAKLRHARDWFFKNYFVETMEDSRRIAAPGTEDGALAMMVLTYWDQACALLNYGLLHDDLFFETSGEFHGVWERVKPIVAQARELFKNKNFLGHLEHAAQRFEAWSENHNPGHIAALREFMATTLHLFQNEQTSLQIVFKIGQTNGISPDNALDASQGKTGDRLRTPTALRRSRFPTD